MKARGSSSSPKLRGLCGDPRTDSTVCPRQCPSSCCPDPWPPRHLQTSSPRGHGSRGQSVGISEQHRGISAWGGAPCTPQSWCSQPLAPLPRHEKGAQQRTTASHLPGAGLPQPRWGQEEAQPCRPWASDRWGFTGVGMCSDGSRGQRHRLSAVPHRVTAVTLVVTAPARPATSNSRAV